MEATGLTELLDELRGGRREAFDELLPLVYDELSALAHHTLRARRSDTLCTTALVHELYLRLAGGARLDWANRAHFFTVAAVAMRRILVDRARRRHAEKRGGVQRAVTLDERVIVVGDQGESLLALDEALTELAALEPRLARVVECRFFGGLTEDETAAALGVTARTVRRDWVKARVLLYEALRR